MQCDKLLKLLFCLLDKLQFDFGTPVYKLPHKLVISFSGLALYLFHKYFYDCISHALLMSLN